MKQIEFDTQKSKREDAKANARPNLDFNGAKNISLVSRF